MKTAFADWLSPMLVKELRQGVRSRAFVSTFILLQAAMLLNVLIGLVNTDSDGAEGSTVFFWVLVGISVLFILPLSGVNSVGGEIKANTLELIFLTRLTALRIITGKWLAIFAQAVLLVSAVLPYLVLRYFIGGINLAAELVSLAVMLGASAVFSAVTIGISPYQTRVVRAFLIFAILMMLWGSAAPIFLLLGRFGPAGPVGLSPWLIIPSVGCAVIVLLLMLEIGASKIAPDAENHAAAKRTLAAAAFLVALGADFLPGSSVAITIATFLLAIGVCAAALCEQPRWIGSIYRPFAKHGFLGRALGLVLYPGWFTGFLFTSVIFVAFAALMAHQKMLGSAFAWLRMITALGTLLLPVAVTRLFFPKTQRPIVIFFAVQVCCLIVTLMCWIIDSLLKTKLEDFSAFLPVSTLLHSASEVWTKFDFRAISVTAVTALSWLVLLAVSSSPLRRVREIERLTTQPPKPDAPLA